MATLWTALAQVSRAGARAGRSSCTRSVHTARAAGGAAAHAARGGCHPRCTAPAWIGGSPRRRGHNAGEATTRRWMSSSGDPMAQSGIAAKDFYIVDSTLREGEQYATAQYSSHDRCVAVTASPGQPMQRRICRAACSQTPAHLLLFSLHHPRWVWCGAAAQETMAWAADSACVLTHLCRVSCPPACLPIGCTLQRRWTGSALTI